MIQTVSQILISGRENPIGPGWISCPVLVQSAITSELGLYWGPLQDWAGVPWAWGRGAMEEMVEISRTSFGLKRSIHL